MSDHPDRRFDVPLEELERSAHVPPQDQVEEMPETEPPSSGWAWDEERRQSRLAGGA